MVFQPRAPLMMIVEEKIMELFFTEREFLIERDSPLFLVRRASYRLHAVPGVGPATPDDL